MVAQGYIGRHPGDSSVVISRQSFTASGITTDFTFASGYTVGYFDLYINGVKLVEGSDYTASDSATFTVLNGGAQNGDVLEGVAYKAFNLGDTYTSRVGIQSAGIAIGNAETLNFVGTGNTFRVNGTTIDVSISGGAGAGGTWTTYDSNTGITTTKKVKIDNNLEVTGVSTFTGIATFASSIDANGGITATTGTFEDLTGAGAIVFSTGDGVLDDSASLSWTSGTNTLNATNIDSNGHTELDQLNVSGITTLGVTSISQLSVSGISTFNNVKIVGSGSNIEFTPGSWSGSSDYMKFWVGNNNGAHYAEIDASGGAFQILNTSHPSGTLDFRAKEDYSFQVNGYYSILNQSSGGVKLFHPASQGDILSYKLETTADGIAVAGVVTATSGIVTYYGDGSNLTGISVGITTTASSPTANSVVTLNLSSAQHHELNLSAGITTITCSGGSIGDSHSVLLIQPTSGIATVGFSTYFLFPSGSTPSLPEADGSISLLSFTVNRVGAAGTQLLTGASLNYS